MQNLRNNPVTNTGISLNNCLYTEWPKKCIHSLLTNIFGINLNEISISFKFIPKILMSKECINFFGPLCILPMLNMTYVFVCLYGWMSKCCKCNLHK